MNRRRNYNFAKVTYSENGNDESQKPGPVITYTMSKEEIEKKYGKVSKEKTQKFCTGWPECGQPNTRHYLKKNLDYMEDYGEEDPMDRVDPAWFFDNAVYIG